MRPSQETLVYVGSYAEPSDEGIHVYSLGAAGELLLRHALAGFANPSFLTLNRAGTHLYTVNEASEGAVSAFAVDPGALTLLNQQPTHGSPCYLSLDASERFVLVANYGGGSVVVLPRLEHGHLEKASDLVQHHGSSLDPERQEEPHAHSVMVGPQGRFVFAADLGIDKLMVYSLDTEKGKLEPHTTPWIELPAGAGPRHLAFHPQGSYAYLMNELNATITAFAYHREEGTLQSIQTVPTLPADFHGENTCADIHVHPSGKFLYGSNRGHDSIVIFSVDPQTGKLELLAYEPTQGKTPRNFAIDPSGTFLLAANQDSDTIITFRIEPSGTLAPTGHITQVQAPVCIKMIG